MHGRRSTARGLLVLALLVIVLHGRSINDGLVLDDYNHRAELRECGWSFRGLTMASHLGDPRRRVRMWWQDQAHLYFFRPLAFFLMKCEYVASRWSPTAMHAFSLAWTLVCAALVAALARQVLRDDRLALLAGALFILHPGNWLTGRWIACQNEQMATAFMLTAILAWGRAAGWWAESRGPSGWLAVAIIAQVAALGCRETSILLPAMLALGDLLLVRRTMLRRWWAYLLLAAIAGGYLVLRHAMLGPLTIPAPPYAYPPGSPNFARFMADKVVYYILGLWAGLPIVGFAGTNLIREHSLPFYASAAVIVAIWALLVWRLPSRRAALFWLAVSVVPLLPVLPVFASAHHLYLASVGAVIAALLVLQWVLKTRGTALRRTAIGATAALVTVCVAANFVYDLGSAGLSAASRLPPQQVLRLGGPLHAGDTLFFINLPLLGFNCMPALEEATGAVPLEGWALSFSPQFLQMDSAGEARRLDEHTLAISCPAPGYFSGLTGRSILEGIGRKQPFAAGERFSSPHFEALITASDQAGVREMRFTFNRPLTDPAYHFFIGSPVFDAYPLRFSETNCDMSSE